MLWLMAALLLLLACQIPPGFNDRPFEETESMIQFHLAGGSYQLQQVRRAERAVSTHHGCAGGLALWPHSMPACLC